MRCEGIWSVLCVELAWVGVKGWEWYWRVLVLSTLQYYSWCRCHHSVPMCSLGWYEGIRGVASSTLKATFAARFWTPEEVAELLLFRPFSKKGRGFNSRALSLLGPEDQSTLGRDLLYLDVVLLTSRAMARWEGGWGRAFLCSQAQQTHCYDMGSFRNTLFRGTVSPCRSFSRRLRLSR